MTRSRRIGKETHLSHRSYPRSPFRRSHRWSGSIPPCKLHCSCRGCYRTVFQSPYCMNTWCRSCSGTALSVGCPCCARRWTNLAHSPHSRNWAWRSRAQWGAPGPPGCQADHPDKDPPPGPRSHFPRWPWKESCGCLLRWYLGEDKSICYILATHIFSCHYVM